jgi:hypothetical protein
LSSLYPPSRRKAISSYFVLICLASPYKGNSTRKTPSAKSFGNQRRYLRLGQRGARMVEFARLWSSFSC